MNEDAIRIMSKELAAADREMIRDLVQARRDNGLSQRDVANVLGVEESWVTDIERYDSDPRLSELRRYTNAIYTAALEKEEA